MYGARRVFEYMREAGELCGKQRVAKIMRLNQIKALRAYKTLRPISGRRSLIAPNRLEREFTISDPDTARVTDITYIRTWKG